MQRANFDQAMDELGLALDVPLPDHLCPAGGVTLAFKKLRDFHPDALTANTPFLKNIGEAVKFIKAAQSEGLAEEEIRKRLHGWPGLLPDLQWEPRKPRTGSADAIDDILKRVSLPGGESVPSLETQSCLARVESLLRQVLMKILAHEDLRSLESAWRGLRLLMSHDNGVAVKIIPVSLATLEETLNHLLLELIQDLPSLVLVDLPFDNSSRSLELLGKVAVFSETLLVPTVGWITPQFFYLDTWRDLSGLPFLPHYLEEPVFAKWRSLKESSSGRWVALTCNRFLIRFPYGADNRAGPVSFEELERLWISPVYAAGSLIAQSFIKNGWPTRFTEWQRIRLDNLALSPVEGNRSLPTEALFTEERIEQLIKGGLIPLVAPANKDFAFLPFETTIAGGSLSRQLFIARITQFLFRCKDNWEQDLEPEALEIKLQGAFSLFWEKTGHRKPRNLKIEVGKPTPAKPAKVRIAVEPSREILPEGAKVELEMNW